VGAMKLQLATGIFQDKAEAVSYADVSQSLSIVKFIKNFFLFQ
jgi:hypothetical protein